MKQSPPFAAMTETPARFTADEFVAMADAGAFDDFAGKIELVEGVIVRMAAALTPHFWHQRQLFKKLDALFGEGRDGWIVGQEPSVRLGPATVRDPDIAILRRPETIERVIFEASAVLMVAEVSDATLTKDRGAKNASYAKAGIPHYWIIDLRNRRVEARSQPENGKYKVKNVIAFGQPLIVPGTDETIILE